MHECRAESGAYIFQYAHQFDEDDIDEPLLEGDVSRLSKILMYEVVTMLENVVHRPRFM